MALQDLARCYATKVYDDLNKIVAKLNGMEGIASSFECSPSFRQVDVKAGHAPRLA
jgi:hypothetical protein